MGRRGVGVWIFVTEERAGVQVAVDLLFGLLAAAAVVLAHHDGDVLCRAGCGTEETVHDEGLVLHVFDVGGRVGVEVRYLQLQDGRGIYGASVSAVGARAAGSWLLPDTKPVSLLLGCRGAVAGIHWWRCR